jgi:hypothetical protein
MANTVNNWTKTALTTITDSYQFLVGLTTGEIKPITWASIKTLLAAVFVSKTGNETIAGTKTFSSTISGSIDGNSGTVTNGVYTTGNQTVAGVKTFSDPPVMPALGIDIVRGRTPSSSTDTGTDPTGRVWRDDTYVYFRTSTNVVRFRYETF